MPAPASAPTASIRLRPGLGAASRLNFWFSGLLLLVGLQLSAASLFALAGFFYEAAVVETLLASALFLGVPMRQRLGTIYTISLFVPDVGLLWVLVERLWNRAPVPWDWFAIAGACAVVMNCIEAGILAQFRPKGRSFTAFVLPLLRSMTPTNLAVMVAGLATLITHSMWPDLVVGYPLAVSRFRRSDMPRRLARLDLAREAASDTELAALIAHYPRLGLLKSGSWQEALVSRSGKHGSEHAP